MNQQQELVVAKVPFLKDTLKTFDPTKVKVNDLVIIGVIDASGSMGSCWPNLSNFWNQSIPKDNLITITFDTRPRLWTQPQLSTRIKDHGGGGTEIVPAFEEMEKTIKTIPQGRNITVIFISDGQDNHVGTIQERLKKQLKGNPEGRQINFICLGVESGFPTQIAMQLRELYHSGDPQIPAVYLIEHQSEQAFFNKFETMKKYFYPAQILKLTECVLLYPYDEEVDDEVFEGQWVVLNRPNVAIVGEHEPIPLEPIFETKMHVDDVVDLFKLWGQNLLLKSMQKDALIIKKAEKALEIMERITNRMNQQFQMDVLNFDPAQINDPNQPFNIRAKRNYVYKYANKLLFFVDEVKSLVKGVNPQQLSEFEQAKRLNIGTITGKHHQKALALKGITVEEFRKIKDEFIQIVQLAQYRPVNEQGQERSVVLLENQRDILSDKQAMIEGLNYVKSQYDFAETFPLIGHGVKVKRLEGCQVNPWIVQVDYVAQQNKIIDSAFLIKNNFKVELNTGGDNKEEINCILPLYDESDADLQPILRSRIMKLLLTFMVQQNVDTLYEETYLALLANTLIYILQQKESQWKQETLKLIYDTTTIVYQGTLDFENYIQKLATDPKAAYLQKEQQYEDHVAIAKPFFYIFYGIKQGIWDQEKFEVQIQNLILYYFLRLKEKNNKLHSFLSLKLQNNDEKFEREQYKQYFKDFSNTKEFRKQLEFKMRAQILDNKEKQSQVCLLNQNVYAQDVKLTLNTIELFYKTITGKDYDAQKYIHFIYHVFKQDNQNIFDPINFDNLVEIKVELSKQGEQKDLLKGSQKLIDQIEQDYIINFVQTHMLTEPMLYENLLSECQKHGQDITKIAYNEKSGLASNCCFSKNCPFYLKPLGLEFRQHIQIWGDKVPRGFHQQVIAWAQVDKNVEEIVQLSHQQWKEFPKFYHGTEEIVHNYIQLIIEKYGKGVQQVPEGQLRHSGANLRFPKKQGKKLGYQGKAKNAKQVQQKGGRGGRGGRGAARGGRGRGGNRKP